jgi:hypothetical protein
VSWRGCSQEYVPEQMDLTGQNFYDRFDRYPTAWDQAPAAQYMRDIYPGGYPAFSTEEPNVVVTGDPVQSFPLQVLCRTRLDRRRVFCGTRLVAASVGRPSNPEPDPAGVRVRSSLPRVHLLLLSEVSTW